MKKKVFVKINDKKHKLLLHFMLVLRKTNCFCIILIFFPRFMI